MTCAILLLLARVSLFLPEQQDPMIYTYDIFHPEKSPHSVIYYEDEAAWIMIVMGPTMNKVVTFVAKEAAHTLMIIEDPSRKLKPMIIQEDIIASSELGEEDYTLTKRKATNSPKEESYQVENLRENRVYELITDPDVDLPYAPHTFYRLYPALRELGLITQIRHPDGAVEKLVDGGAESRAVVAQAMHDATIALSDKSYNDIEIIYDEYGASSFKELVEKMKAKFKELGY